VCVRERSIEKRDNVCVECVNERKKERRVWKREKVCECGVCV